jgi:hypothetical protein
VTAGHCLKDLDADIDAGDIKITGGVFLDHFGHLAVYEEGYPFTYERGLGYYVEDKNHGLDFALIKLDQLQAKAFLNNNLVFISRKNWIHQHKLEFESFLMLGIKEGSNTVVKDGKVILNMEQLLLKVDQISRDDIDTDKMPPEVTKLPSELWFVGKVAGRDKVDSIKGLSGGPIYGFRHDEQGRLNYHAVALQSHWWKQSRIIFGCPLTLFAEECYQILKGIIEEMTADDGT